VLLRYSRACLWSLAGAHSDIEYTVVNLLRGVFVRTELNMLSRGPQLARADAGTSWQIADARRCHPEGGRTRRRLPVVHFRRRFASSLRRRALASWSPNRAVLDDGRQHGEQDQGARPRPVLYSTRSWCLRYPPWPRRQYMLAEERLCKRHPGAASVQLHGCARASELS
jgi:hypothetical protein